MKTKIIYGEEFEIYEGGKIEGDFIHKGKNIYIDGNLEVTGHFECERFKITGSIDVYKSYVVSKWEEVGGYQKVGRYQKVGEYQEIRWSQEVGEYQEVKGRQKVGRSQKVGWYQKVGEYQEIGGYQEVGEYQEVGGDATIKLGMNIGLSVSVGGVLSFGKRLFAGTCTWRDITDEDKTITCAEIKGGEVVHGIVIETEAKEVEELTIEEVCNELGRIIKIKK